MKGTESSERNAWRRRGSIIGGLIACVLSLAACIGPLGVFGASARERASAPTASKLGREIPSMRTKASRTFVARDGRRVTRVYSGAVNFKNRRGKWQRVDTRLRRDHGRLLNRTNGFSTSLPSDIGTDSFRVRKNANWVKFSLRGARGGADVRGNVATYRNALEGVDASYRLLSDSLKETLVLRDASARRRFVFDLQMRRGLRPRLLRSKAVVLRDRRHRTRMTMAAPFMVDAKGRRHRVGVKLANIDGRWRMTLALSDAWLEQRGRAWPVQVDPAVYSTGDADCALSAAAPNTSSCADPELYVGRYGGTDWQSVLRFDGLAAAIPRGAEVHGASLVLYQTAASNQNDAVQLEVRALDESFTGSATWNSNDGTDRWSEPGGETAEGDEAKAEWNDYIYDVTGTRYFHMYGIVREWARDKRANHGLLLRATNTNNGAKFAATENATSANRPYLEYNWSPRMGERRGYVHERQQLSDRISMGVNVASGNLIVHQTDFSMPGGLGPDIQASRTYNSLNTVPGAYGNWLMDTGHDFRANQAAGGEYVILCFPGTAAVPYTRNDDGSYNSPPGFDNKLTRDDSNGTYTLVDNKSQTKYSFGAYAVDGRLDKVEDRNGRTLKLVYNASNQLIRIEDSSQDADPNITTDDTRFTYTSGRVTSMTDAGGRSYAYGYTGSALTSYTDPQNGATFKTLYEYNGVGGKLSKITTPQGRITTIEYYPTGHEYEGKVKAFTRVTNPVTLTGNRTEFEYVLRRDGSGEARVTDPIGSRTTDENDRVTRYTFDDQGRVAKTKDALGRETQQKITSTSKVESYTAAGNTGTTPNTSFVYDSDDNAKSSDTPVNAGSVKACADFGAPDPDTGTDEEKQCDAPAPAPTYGPNGYQGVPTSIPGGAYLPGRATSPQGNRTNFSWTSGGLPNTVQQTDKDGALTAGVSMAYGNDTDDSDDTKPGRLTSITDHRGNVTSYDYDNQGNVDVITPPNPGTVNPTGPTRLEYHATLSRLEKVQDGKDKWRVMTYDSLDRLTRIAYTGADQVLASGEPYVDYTYDRDGNQTSEVSREETTNTLRTRTMTYDDLNRVTFESLPGGASNTYTYDAVGNLRSLTDAGGKVEYTYDATNQVRAVYEPGVAKPTKFKHNKDGLREETKYPNGVEIDQEYDGAFRLKSITSHVGTNAPLQKQSYTYQDPVTSRETPLMTERFDEVLGQKTGYAYDALDRLKSATIRSSSTSTELAKYAYTLDGVGNIIKRDVSGSQSVAGVTDYTYNSANELCARAAGTTTSVPSTTCPTSSLAYTYDKNGNQTGAPGRSATYNLLDQTTNLTISGSPTSMVYLGAGQDRWITEGSGSFQHNVLGVGKRTVGTSTDYFTRDESGKPVSRRNGTTREYYLFDALGSITGLTGSTGTVTQRYDYEPYGTGAPTGSGKWGAYANAADVANGQIGFAGGYRSVAGLYHLGQRYYDPVDMRWTQPDPLDQSGDLREGNRFQYVGGDPVNLADLRGLHLNWAQRAARFGAATVVGASAVATYAVTTVATEACLVANGDGGENFTCLEVAAYGYTAANVEAAASTKLYHDALHKDHTYGDLAPCRYARRCRGHA